MLYYNGIFIDYFPTKAEFRGSNPLECAKPFGHATPIGSSKSFSSIPGLDLNMLSILF